MKKISAIILLFICATSGAQINFEPGYFVNNNGKRTECMIKNVAWKNSPIEFEYVLNENEKAQIANISEIREFNVGNTYKFRRFDVKLDKSSANSNSFSSTKNPIWINKTVYLKFLVEGEINLYQYEDTNGVRYFVSTGNHNEAEQLVYKQYMSSNSSYSENNHFRQQLSLLLKNKDISDSEVKKIKYNRADLSEIIMKVNKLESKEAQVTNYEKNQNQGEVNVKVTLGVYNAGAKLALPATQVDFGNKTVIAVGIEAEYVLPFNQNKWSIFINPNYKNVDYESNIDAYKKSSVEFKHLEIPMGIRHYMYLNQSSKIFLDAGYVTTINFNSTLTRSEAVYKIRGNANVFFGIGYNYKRYSVEARYTPKRQLIELPFLKVNYTVFGLNAAYKFL